jgi:Secretion system C-terminal sorting domain
MSMKKFTTLCLATAVATAVFGQQPSAPKTRVATQERMTKSVSYESKQDLINRSANESMLRAQPISQGQTFSPNGKVAAVNPVALGQAANVFTTVTTEQNQVWADDALGLVAFIHRSDPGVWGGSSGNLRYDVSVDGGATFTNDIGPLNPALARVSRYPNVTGFNPTGATNPFDSWLAYSAPTLNSTPDFDGHVTGLASVTTGTPVVTETYSLLTQSAYLPAGLCQGAPGEFWTADREYAGGAFTGNIFVNKGVFNPTPAPGDIVWSRYDTITPNNNLSFDGSARVVGPNIAFSPDGQTGWIAWVGDLVGGRDSVLSPIFMKSTDAGATWGAPVEFDMNTVAWIADSLQSLWTDSLGNPASSGVATCAFDFDLTVDILGNPHIGVVVGSGSSVSATPGYSIFSSLAMFIGDIWTPDGGATWTVNYISPVLAFRGDFGTGANGGVGMDNHVQIARNPSGNTIFFSWADSDTSQFGGSMAGIGFGVSDQLAPNLRIASRRPYQNAQTYPKLVTDGDLVWEGRALWPTMAPIVLEDAGCFTLPIVMADLLNNDGFQATAFWYFGNDASFCNADYCDAAQLVLSWDAFAGPGLTPPCAVNIDNGGLTEDMTLGQSFPNPTSGEAIITFELSSASNVSMNLTNMYGQEVAVLANGDFAAGAHRVDVNTRSLAAGVYFYTLTANGKAQTKKMIVTK